MRFYLLLLFLVLFSKLSNAQYIYEEAHDIEVLKNNKALKFPFTSGYNAVQFSELDLNQDGTMDLLVYDRSIGQVRPYVNLGIKDSVAYRYEPKYALKFPRLRSWLLTADYNKDGKMDLFDGESGIQLWENKSNKTDGLKFELIGDIKSAYNPGSKEINIAISFTSLPGIYDIDNDGDIDIFTINRNNGVTVEYHRNLAIETGDSDYLNFERRNTCWGNFYDSSGSYILNNCDGPPPGGEIFGPDNEGETIAESSEVLREKKAKHGITIMITPIDIDGNSSTDLIISDFDNYQAKLLLNEDSIAPYTESRIYKTVDSFPNYDIPINVLFPAVFFIDVNNDGKKDMLGASNTVITTAGFDLTSDHIFYYKNVSTNDKIKLEFKQKDFLLNETLDFGIGAFPVFFDYNKDGLYDLVIGNYGNVFFNDTSSTIIGRLQLFKNTGTLKSPRFELIDSNYLDIPSRKINQSFDGPTRNLIPTFGDIDNDGDQDLLLGEINDNIYLFEDTSSNQATAAFKFHPTPYSGLNFKNLGETNSPRLYDINGDEVLDLIVSGESTIAYYFINFGTKSKPIFNIRLDSIVYQSNRIFRYYFEDTPNFELLKIGDSVAVNNSQKSDIDVKLIIQSINVQENYIECYNTIELSVVDDKLNEINTDAYLTFFNRNWGNLQNVTAPKVFPYRENDHTQLIVGSAAGNIQFYDNIPDTISPRDTFKLFDEKYVPNYGMISFIDGKDINDDGMIDLVVGNVSGGIKILIAQYGVGFKEIDLWDNDRKNNNFKLFPNPAKENVMIKLYSEGNYISRYTLSNMSGKAFKQGQFNENETSLNLESIPKGIYLISIHNRVFIETKKLIIR